MHAVYTELIVMGSILILMFMNLFQKQVCCEALPDSPSSVQLLLRFSYHFMFDDE